jgi:leucine dehydrogenase
MDVGRLLATSGHEQVVFAAERDVGLRLIVAVHSTALGPALGGIRFWHYDSEEDALVDVLRLSEAMTLKASVAGLHQGGGKAVCIVDDPPPPRDRPFLHALGRAIHQLGGRYLAAEDVGASQADMDGIAEVTPWVTGVDPARGGSGDPSPVTAQGVLHGMRAACRHAFGDASLAGRRVVVQGTGHVGSHLVQLLVAEGADVAVADIDDDRVATLVSELGVRAVPAEIAAFEECDVLAPCALGGVLSRESVARLRCRVVCGGANNQLAERAADDALVERGIVYAPDFVVNAGGIINIAEEFTGYDRERALAATARIEGTTDRVLDEAARTGVPPGRCAEAIGRRRVREEGGGRRWTPGDPAAWTNGAPLTTLRPSAG